MHGRADDGCNMQASYSQVTLQRDAISARISGKKERHDEIPSNILLLYAHVGQCFLSTTRFWALTVCVFCSVLGTNVFVLYIFPLFLLNIVCVT